MTKLEKVATSQNFNFILCFMLVFLIPLQEKIAENANKSYQVCKVIAVLHIYHYIFGIR